MTAARRIGLFRVHAWIGLNLGFLLFIVCFSGTVAIFSWELNWLADPAWRVQPPADGEGHRLSWQDVHDRVVDAYPQALILRLAAPRGDRWAAHAAIAFSPGDIRWVLINPYTGALQGLRSSFNLVSFFRIFHKQLYIVPTIFTVHGTLIVGTLAILLVAAAVTGLLSLKRWWRALLTLRPGRSRRLFWSDLHRLSGIWALVVTLILSLTGIWYLTERIMIDAGALTEEAPPTRLQTGDLRQRPAALVPIDLDRAAAMAQAAYPALTIAEVALPIRLGEPFTFTGQAEALLVRDRANQVQVDPFSGDVVGLKRAVDLGPFDRWIETADPLHFGTFGGLISRLVWFIGGLLICAGILAGLCGAWMRQKDRRLPRRRFAAAMAILPTLTLLAASIFGTWAYGGEALRSAQRDVRVTPLLAGELGPWSISVDRLDLEASSARSAGVSIRFDRPTQANFERATLWVDDAAAPAGLRPMKRFVDRLWGQANAVCRDRTDGCQLKLMIREWDGTEHAASFDLRPPAPGAVRLALPRAAGPTSGEVIVISAFVLCLLLPLVGWIRLLRLS